MTGENNIDLRQANLERIYSILRAKSPMTMRQLAQEVKLTFASVSTICTQLIDQQLIRVVDSSVATGGRKARSLEYVSNYAYTLMIDMHHTEYISMAFVTLSSTVVKRVFCTLDDGIGLEGLKRIVERCYLELKEDFEGKLFSVIVGVSAVYDEKAEILMQSSNPVLERVNLKAHLSPFFKDFPILIENDANLAAYSQLNPSVAKRENQLFLFFTQGIGLGLIIDGQLYRGARGFAGELGHLKLSGVERLCNKCGNVGCMRTVVPLAAIARDLDEYPMLRSIGSARYCDHLLARAETEVLVHERILFTAQKIGEILAELFDILNPARIFLGGNNWKLYGLMSQEICQTTRGLSNLAREVDLQIQFVEEPINDLLAKGVGEMAFRYFVASHLPVPISCP